MPSKPLHPCNHPSCQRLTSERFCEKHAKKETIAYERTRKTASRRGYDHRWSKIRKMKLAADPLCERCGRAAVLVHHKDRNPKNNAAENHESLCEACHVEEHKTDRWGR